MVTIAIDCGASFLKAAKMQNDRILRQLQIQTPPKPAANSSKNADKKLIERLLEAVCNILTDLTAGETEVGLGISNEMHGFVLALEDGTPFTDHISWQQELGDITVAPEGKSSREILQEHFCAAPGVRFRYTGMPLRAGLPSCNLLYLSRAGNLAGAPNQLFFYTLGDYLLCRLAGCAPDIHPTNAAATGLYDLEKKDWDEELTAFCCSGARIMFPTVGGRSLDFCFGETRIHALPAIGDQQAALLGAGLEEMETISFNLGTGAQVSVLSDNPSPEEGVQIRPYFGGRSLCTIPHIPCGRALNVYFRFVRDLLSRFEVDVDERVIWDKVLEMERDGVECGLFCDLSFFENAITPNRAGSISQIGEYTLTGANLFHAVLRAMIENFLRCADKLAQPDGRFRKILFSGGVARRIEAIRDGIVCHYSPDITATIAENETLIGIARYLAMDNGA